MAPILASERVIYKAKITIYGSVVCPVYPGSTLPHLGSHFGPRAGHFKAKYTIFGSVVCPVYPGSITYPIVAAVVGTYTKIPGRSGIRAVTT